MKFEFLGQNNAKSRSQHQKIDFFQKLNLTSLFLIFFPKSIFSVRSWIFLNLCFFFQNTELRDNVLYIKWYGLIGASIIMVFIPGVILILSAFAMCLGIPEGNQRKKVLRIMITIITMFVICHVPKVCISEKKSFQSRRTRCTWTIRF